MNHFLLSNLLVLSDLLLHSLIIIVKPSLFSFPILTTQETFHSMHFLTQKLAMLLCNMKVVLSLKCQTFFQYNSNFPLTQHLIQSCVLSSSKIGVLTDYEFPLYSLVNALLQTFILPRMTTCHIFLNSTYSLALR